MRWDPKNQRPELWKLYNARMKAKGESIRAFPLSNWTELDIWQYIHPSGSMVPLYFAQTPKVVERDGMLIMVDDDRMNCCPARVAKRWCGSARSAATR
jgi:sulfate adenylyltransferase subunit 2